MMRGVMESATCPHLAAPPLVSLLPCLLVSSVMPPDEEEWAMVERRGPHLLLQHLLAHVLRRRPRHAPRGDSTRAAPGRSTTADTARCRSGRSRTIKEVFQALDFVISEARKHKVRLILSLCNDWVGRLWRESTICTGGKEAGLELTSDDDFFSDPTVKTYYKTFVKAWIQEMASYVKFIDHIHLLEIGFESFYGPSTPEFSDVNPDAYLANAGTDFIRNHRVPGIDLASVHVYSDTWLPHSVEDLHLHFVKTWMLQHIDDAANLLRMPILIGEFGVSLKDGKFGNELREAFMETVIWHFLELQEGRSHRRRLPRLAALS